MSFGPSAVIRPGRLFVAGALALALAGASGGCGGSDRGRIRVVTQPPGATILCNGAPAGETIAGLPAGTHLLDIRKPGYEPLRAGVPLTAGEDRMVEYKLEPQRGLLLVESEPPGAAVEVDGAFAGQTPFLLATLAAGDHAFLFTASGHLPRQLAVPVKDRIPQRVRAELDADAGWLTVRVEPAVAAVVKVDGREVGPTPLERQLVPSGTHELEVACDGYASYIETLTLQAKDTREILARLKALPTELSLTSQPPGVRIYVDDQLRGETPLTLTDLAPGEHRVRAERRGYEAQARTLRLDRNSRLTDEFRMQKNSGKLVIVTQPADAKVFVDGEEIGATRAGASDVLSAALEVDFIAAGSRQVKILREGYLPFERTVRIEPNGVQDVNARLVRRFVLDTRLRIKGASGETIFEGMLIQTRPDGSVELQLEGPAPGTGGTIMTVPKSDILRVEKLQAPGT